MHDLLPDISKWTMKTVRNVVRTREYEPGRFDYKAVLVGAKNRGRDADDGEDSVQLSIRKTACALANTQGGYIIFGITDRRVTISTYTDRIVGIPLDRDLRKEFGDNASNIEPELHFDTTPRPLKLQGDPARGVFVVYIAESPFKPHMVMPSHVFYRRGDGGSNEPMRQHEVREHMVYGEDRRRRANLLRLRLMSLHRVADQLNRMQDGELETTFVRLDVDGLDALMADVCGLVTDGDTMDKFIATIARARHINRVLDYAVTPTNFSHQRFASDDMRDEVREFLPRIVAGAVLTENHLAEALGETPYLTMH